MGCECGRRVPHFFSQPNKSVAIVAWVTKRDGERQGSRVKGKEIEYMCVQVDESNRYISR